MRRKIRVKSLFIFAVLVTSILAILFVLQTFEIQKGRLVIKNDANKNVSAPTPETAAPRSIILDLPKLQTQPTCEAYYKRFLDDGILTIGIFLGYKDSRPARFVGDSIETFILIQKLTDPCIGQNQACGFKLNSVNPTRLIKKVEIDRIKFKTDITIWYSSLTLDDDLNRKLPEQKVHSAKVEAAFQEALKLNDMVFYNGHSRDGGGPDFFPPQLDSHHKTDYGWYKNREHGVKIMSDSLTESTQPLILGLFSCASDKHFKSALFKNKKALTLITSSHLLYYADALKNLYGGVHAAMHLLCKDQFNFAMRAHQPKEGSSLQNNTLSTKK